MSTSKARLVRSILTEYFGPTVAAVGVALHRIGRSSAQQILQALRPQTGISAKQNPAKKSESDENITFTIRIVRDSLFVLMQHNLATYAEQPPINIYQLNVLAVLWMLRYPRIITFSKVRFGELGQRIVMHLAANGRATPSTIAASISENIDQVKEIMKQMVDNRFVRVVTAQDSLTPVDVTLAAEAKQIAETDVVTLVNAKSSRARPGKRAADENYFEQMASKRLKAIDERINDESFYAINVPRYTVEFRHQISHEYAVRKVNESAAGILDSLYKEGARQYSDPMLDERTPALTMTKLAQVLPKDLPFAIHGFPANGSESARQQAINQYLEMISHAPVNLVTKTLAESGREGFTVDYQLLMPAMAQSLIESFIGDTMGSLSTRLYRILREKQIADDKMLSKAALLSQKEVRERMLRLFQIGIVQMQEVPRSADRAPARTIFLWKIMSPKSVRRALLYRAYKTLLNLRERRSHEQALRKLLLRKLERSDVAADHSLLSPEEQQELKKYEHCVDRLSLAELHLEEEIMLLRDLQF